MNTESLPPKDKLIDKLDILKSISIMLEEQKNIFRLIETKRLK